MIRDRMKAAHSRHEAYANYRYRQLEFQEGDYVFIHTSPMKGLMKLVEMEN